jgi:hypothetical protein
MLNVAMLNVGGVGHADRTNGTSATLPTLAELRRTAKKATISIVTRTPEPVFSSPPALPAVSAARHWRSRGGLHANFYAVNCDME